MPKQDNYIDGFVFPLPRKHLTQYKEVAEQIADIWKEYGALAYFEYVAEDLSMEGTRSFGELVDLKDQEVVVFGWMVFPSKTVRDQANAQIPQDARMAKLMAPLSDPNERIFDPARMVYGGFEAFISSPVHSSPDQKKDD